MWVNYLTFKSNFSHLNKNCSILLYLYDKWINYSLDWVVFPKNFFVKLIKDNLGKLSVFYAVKAQTTEDTIIGSGFEFSIEANSSSSNNSINNNNNNKNSSAAAATANKLNLSTICLELHVSKRRNYICSVGPKIESLKLI